MSFDAALAIMATACVVGALFEHHAHVKDLRRQRDYWLSKYRDSDTRMVRDTLAGPRLIAALRNWAAEGVEDERELTEIEIELLDAGQHAGILDPDEEDDEAGAAA